MHLCVLNVWLCGLDSPAQCHYDRVDGLCAPAEAGQSATVLTAGQDGLLSLIEVATRHPVWKFSLPVRELLHEDCRLSVEELPYLNTIVTSPLIL